MQFLKKRENLVFYLICAFIAVFSFVFHLINLNVLAIISVLLIAFFAISDKQIFDDWALRFIVLVAFGIAMMDMHVAYFNSLYFMVFWPCSYLIGRYVVADKQKSEKRAFITVGIMTLFMFLQGVIQYLNHNDGLEAVDSWDGWNDFFTGEHMARTVFVFCFCAMASWLFLGIIYLKNKKPLAAIIIVFNIVAAALDFFFAKGRICLLIQVLVTGIMLVIYIIKEKKYKNKKIRVALISVISVGIIVAIIAAVLVALNIAGLRDVYANSFLARDGGIFGNVRYRSIKEGLILSFQQPIGGWQTTTLDIPHDVFLLFSRDYGVVIFLLMMGYELMTFINAIKLLLTKCSKVDYVIVALLLSINIYYIIETCPWRYREYWFFILFVGGIVKGRLESKKQNNE